MSRLLSKFRRFLDSHPLHRGVLTIDIVFIPLIVLAIVYVGGGS